MGEKSISTQVKIDGDITPDFSQDWAVEFQGEKYIMPFRKPQGAKGNESLESTIDITFQHWAIYQLKRWPFVTIQPIKTGTAIADEEVADAILNLGDFCELFGQVLAYYYGDSITIDLNSEWKYKKEPTPISINHSYIWDVLIKFYELFGVRWAIEAATGNDNTVKGGERYVIKVGYPTTEVDHIFEYGFDGGLLKVERQVQSNEIRNMIKGRGGEKNLPRFYFKQVPEEEQEKNLWHDDPDWVEELADIYFLNLMPASFRSYIQGWKAAHISKYPGYTPKGEANAYSPWAYRKGYTDTKFHPVEFVADEITINPATGDKQVEILPGFAPYVKKGSSLDAYGPLQATLDNNENIYPTIQGTGLDVAVAVERIESDDVESAAENDAQAYDVEGGATTRVVNPGASDITVKCGTFVVPKDMTGTLEQTGHFSSGIWIDHVTSSHSEVRVETEGENYEVNDISITVYNSVSGEKLPSPIDIPPGSYRCNVTYKVRNKYDRPISIKLTIGCTGLKLVTSSLQRQWNNTFNIWVKNIWNTTKLSTETESQYSERVWRTILGDRDNNTAKVVFTTGMLAHEDYEFTIVDLPTYDTSKSYEEKNDNGNALATHNSHWRIRLAKSDAEIKATGLYVPSTQKQGKAGDRFIFTGIELMYVPYVTDAEKRLDDGKKDVLREKSEIKPTCVVTTDRVRLNNEGKPNALINRLRTGNSLRLYDKRFFPAEEDKTYETLYLQSITYTYREPSSDDAALNPDVEIVLGNEYTTSANPISAMQGDISSLQNLIGSVSNIEQIVRAAGDKLYMRKDGIPDRSLSPTQFFSLLTSGGFRNGIIGGEGWGFFKDENGNWVLETDKINVRQDFQVNNLVINQVLARGGMIVESAAQIEVSRVFDTANGYECHFDTKNGSIANLFQVGDIAYCNRLTPENGNLKFYKRRVEEVTEDSITLSKTDVNGNGIPTEGDTIVHYGSYTEPSRRYVKVRDVIGGGYERYIEGLDSVNASGTEYYFVGRQDGDNPRWFIGDKNGDYAEWEDGKLNIRGRLDLLSPVGGGTLGDVVAEAGNAGLRLVLSEQAAGVACDAQGNPTGALPTVTATVYRGTTEDTGWDFSASGTGCGVDKLSRNAFRVSSLTAETASVNVTATKAGRPTLRAQVSLYKVRPGADGKPATVYSVEASPGVVMRKPGGGFNVSSVQVTKYRTTGDAPREATPDKHLYYSFEGAAGGGTLLGEGSSSMGVPTSYIPDGATAVVLTLRQGNSAASDALDALTIPVLTDAADLAIGGTNLLKGTNRGTAGWIANYSSGTGAEGRFTLSEGVAEGGVRGVTLTNSAASVDTPSWQIAMFPLDPSVIRPGKRYRMSFDAVSATEGTVLRVNPQQATGHGKLSYELPDVTLSQATRRYSVALTGRAPSPAPVEGNPYYMCFTVAPGTEKWTEITLSNLKLEQGDVATAWSPAPSDPSDYLTEAILAASREDASFVGGLLLASLLRMGYTGTDGRYNVTAGINGIASLPGLSRVIALWAGGDMVDAAANTDPGASPATAAIFHNGEAYWCGNRIRFTRDHIEVGDNVILDKDGLRLVDDGGRTLLSVVNRSIGDDFPAVQSAFKIDREFSRMLSFVEEKSFPSAGGLQGVSVLRISGGFSDDFPLRRPGEATLPKGSGLSGRVSLSFEKRLATSGGVITQDVSFSPVEVTLLLKGQDTPVARWTGAFRTSGQGTSHIHTASVSFSHTTESDGEYTMRVAVRGSDTPGADAGVAACAVKQTGRVALGFEQQTVLGNDGLLSVWPGVDGNSAAMLVRGKNADGGAAQGGFLVGGYGLRVTEAGFEKTLNGGENWTPCYFPDKT